MNMNRIINMVINNIIRTFMRSGMKAASGGIAGVFSKFGGKKDDTSESQIANPRANAERETSENAEPTGKAPEFKVDGNRARAVRRF